MQFTSSTHSQSPDSKSSRQPLPYNCYLVERHLEGQPAFKGKDIIKIKEYENDYSFLDTKRRILSKNEFFVKFLKDSIIKENS